MGLGTVPRPTAKVMSIKMALHINYLEKTIRSSPCVWCCGCRRLKPSGWLQAAGFRGPGTWTSPCTEGLAVRVLLTSCCGLFPGHSATWASAWCKYLQANSAAGFSFTINGVNSIQPRVQYVVCFRRQRASYAYGKTSVRKNVSSFYQFAWSLSLKILSVLQLKMSKLDWQSVERISPHWRKIQHNKICTV